MADQFTEFKKCITWHKDDETWRGGFIVEKTPTCPGISYTIVATPGQNMRAAKTEISERLFASVTNFCNEHKLDLNSLIKQYSLAKAEKKQYNTYISQENKILTSSIPMVKW